MKLLTILGALLVGALILLGIGGISYHLFRDDGWISRGLGALWNAEYQAPVITVVLIIAAIFVFKVLRTGRTGGNPNSRIPDLVLFTFIATGVYFLGRLLILGEI